MENLTIGFAGIVLMLALMMVRVPIAVALGTVSLGGLWLMRGERAAFGALGEMPYDFSASWTLSAVPMFLLMGAVAFHSGMTRSLFDAARMYLGRLPGGLAVATNFASAGFAAMSGSSVATTAAMGRLAIPEMLRHRYDPALATSVVAASGTLGALIPPSIAFVIYGWFAEQSVSALLIAGIGPGLLTAVIYAALIIGRVRLNPALAPEPDEVFPREQKIRALLDTWPLPVIILGVIVGIYTGTTTPTEAGAAGAALTMVVAAVRRSMKWTTFRRSLVEASKTTAVIFFIVIGTILFTRFLALSGVPTFVAGAIRDMAVSPLVVILAMTVVYLILGMFLEGIGIMLVTLPIFLPIAASVGIDLIWFGVLVVKYVEIGLLTPPVGLNAFVVKSVVGDAVALQTIFRGLVWFLGAEVVIMTLLIAFPDISLGLVRFMN